MLFIRILFLLDIQEEPVPKKQLRLMLFSDYQLAIFNKQPELKEPEINDAIFRCSAVKDHRKRSFRINFREAMQHAAIFHLAMHS